MISAIPHGVLVPALLLCLFAIPILTVIHAGLALGRKNTPASRFLLLGLLPSLAWVIMLAIPGYSGAWFPFLRRYWPPLIEWSWFSGLVSQSWQLWPPLFACLVFGAEMTREGVSRLLVRLTIAAVYVGALREGYGTLWSLGQS